MKILLIDNYDSFVYNIVGLLQRCRKDHPFLEWDVVKNDRITSYQAGLYDAIILSPGPGIPSEAGNLLQVIRHCIYTHPILGICLGCQAIAETFGSKLLHLDSPRHGHSSTLHDVDTFDPIIGFCSNGEATVGRYHSWVIDESTLPKDNSLIVTSRDEDGNIMSFRHLTHPIFGLQFHPESIITRNGQQMLCNFLAITNADTH